MDDAPQLPAAIDALAFNADGYIYDVGSNMPAAKVAEARRLLALVFAMQFDGDCDDTLERAAKFEAYLKATTVSAVPD